MAEIPGYVPEGAETFKAPEANNQLNTEQTRALSDFLREHPDTDPKMAETMVKNTFTQQETNAVSEQTTTAETGAKEVPLSLYQLEAMIDLVKRGVDSKTAEQMVRNTPIKQEAAD